MSIVAIFQQSSQIPQLRAIPRPVATARLQILAGGMIPLQETLLVYFFAVSQPNPECIIECYQITLLRADALANPEHLAKIKEGPEAWNQWREQNFAVRPSLAGAKLGGARLREVDLSSADLSESDLQGADLSGANLGSGFLMSREDARLLRKSVPKVGLLPSSMLIIGRSKTVSSNLSGANLSGAILGRARLSGANLTRANLTRAYLRKAFLNDTDLRGAYLRGANLDESNASRANLSGADLNGANLSGADLNSADLSRASLIAVRLIGANAPKVNLSGADLSGATLMNTNLEGANLTGCLVYGISAWNVRLEGAIQSNLVITPPNESPIQVDNLEVAQFIYLLLNNEKIRSVIDTITSKVVLILGRFTPDRIVVLEAVREELRKRDLLPVLFDFEKPSTRTTVETISTLAHMARFVIADLTDAKSVLQELQAVVPLNPSVPVQPLLLVSQEEPGMFDFFRTFPCVLDTYRYTDQTTLLAELEKR